MASSLPPILQATAGATGSAVANALVFPLDLVTTRLQTARKGVEKDREGDTNPVAVLLKLARQRGLASLYDGLAADTISTVTSNFLYYYLWSLGRKILFIRHSKRAGKAVVSQTQILSAWEELGVGLLAGILSKSITLPASNVCVRQQTEKGDGDATETGMIATAGQILQEDGIKAFWAGLVPSIPLALMPSLSLYLDQLLLRLFLPKSRRAHPPAAVTFALGALSNSLAILPLYPLLLLKTLSQSRPSSKERREGLLLRAKRIIHAQGVVGLYKGIQGQLLKGLLQQGVTLLIKQRIEDAVVLAYRRKRS